MTPKDLEAHAEADLGSRITVYPTLLMGPVFFNDADWELSAREWKEIKPQTFLADRPTVTLRVDATSTLGDALDSACDVLAIFAGDAQSPTDWTRRAARRANMLRFGFVDDRRDLDGITDVEAWSWPKDLPAPQPDGSIELICGHDVTFRQLLADAELGLLRGDPLRPYVFLGRAQGMGQFALETLHFAADSVQAALAAADLLIEQLRDGMRGVELLLQDVVEPAAAIGYIADQIGRHNEDSDDSSDRS